MHTPLLQVYISVLYNGGNIGIKYQAEIQSQYIWTFDSIDGWNDAWRNNET